ncbi:MAG: DNA gyrase subunit A [Alphaproteobacteria bacterium]
MAKKAIDSSEKQTTADDKAVVSIGMDGNGVATGITPIGLGDEMKKSYMEYAMSVIVARALPDVRDGLKPVHRRILYAMKENGYDWSKPFRKSARIVGEVMGKYHPHGDQAIYDSMVRMAQSFSLRLPLIAGQGNFGSLDGDPPAAMRYTEARLAKSAETLLTDIDNDTVDFGTNYDDSISEPLVLPARIPNLLANGASGIAVGMATNIPPHNLAELLHALIGLVNNPEMSDDDIKKIVPGPDFPTGGLILGRDGIDQSFATGRGSIKMRGRVAIETFGKERERIVISEIPYQVNKATMIEKMAELVQNKTIEGISDIRDESDRMGVRVVLEVKKDATAQVLLQQLYKFSPLEISFGVNMLSLNNGLPEMLPLPRVLHRFIEFRDEVIQRRSRYLLAKAKARAHIVAGLIIATENIDAMIDLIKSSKDAAQARQKMTSQQWLASDVVPFLKIIDKADKNLSGSKYKLTDEQASAILDLRLQRLTALEKDKLALEMKELSNAIHQYEKLLADEKSRHGVMVEEFEDILKNFSTPRRTEIIAAQENVEITDLIEKEDMMVSVTYGGYIKRVPLDAYRTQKRGGKGKMGMTTKEDDFVWKVFVADTHTDMLFFSSTGKCYKLKVYEIPESSLASKGKSLVNILPLSLREHITTVLPLPADQAAWQDKFMVFATASGYVRRNLLSDFADERKAGKVAMKLADGDSLVGVLIASVYQDVFLASEQSTAIRFPISRQSDNGDEKGVRVFSGRASNGVRAIKLSQADRVVAMDIMNCGEDESDMRDGYLATVNAKLRLKDKEYAASGSEESLRDKAKVAEFDKTLFTKMAQQEQFVLTINQAGFGQLCSSYDYRTTNRGGKGISNMDSESQIIDAFVINPKQDEVMLVTDGGQTIRLQTKTIRKVSRHAKGVKLATLGGEQKIASVAHISYIDDAEVNKV